MSRVGHAGALGQRLSWWLACQTFLGLSFICSAIYMVTAITLSQRQDETLDQKVLIVQHVLKDADALRDVDALKHELDDSITGHDEIALRMLAEGGQIVYSSTRGAQPQEHRKQIKFDARGANFFDGASSAVLTLSTARDDKLLRRLGWTLAAAVVFGSLVVSLGCFWLVRLGLTPLRQLVQQTRQLSANDFNKRLDGTAQPEELQPLIAQFNALLERLDSSYGQMEGFNADVAHELKTPLANLISSCELGLRKGRNLDEMQELLASNLEELHRMSGIVNDMLFLSQADSGATARCVEVRSLATLTSSVIDFHEAALEEAGLKIEVVGDASGQFDAGLLRRALSNLLDNATRYAQDNSSLTVRIESSPLDGVVSIVVCNRGCPIAPTALPHIFGRFFRADPARTEGKKNHGLGLSIVAAVARMHGGHPIANSSGDTTQIGLVIPQKRS